MKVDFTVDRDTIKSILCHPDVYKTISDDLCPASEDYEVDYNALYIVDEKPVGCFILHQNGSSDWWCHVQVLPQYRQDYAYNFGRAVLSFAFDNIPHCQKLLAQIPTKYPNVLKFAQRMGFEKEGINRHSYLKGGKWFDQYYLGLRREKWDS